MDISPELYEEEVVCFLAERYRVTPRQIVRRFIEQEGASVEREEERETFRLEENEVEILRGLTEPRQARLARRKDSPDF